MANAITWTAVADLTLLQLRASGASWPTISHHLHVGRSAVIERARTLGMPAKTHLPQPKPTPRVARIDRPPLPAGHPLSWGVITDNAPYPYPVFL